MKVNIIVLALGVAMLSSSMLGQSTSTDEPDVINSRESGELHSSLTDILAQEASKTNERLFVIFHRGSNDTFAGINWIRLMNLKAYFTATQKRFGTADPVFAYGKPVAGEGRIEYYLGSRLRLIVFSTKNKSPNFTC